MVQAGFATLSKIRQKTGMFSEDMVNKAIETGLGPPTNTETDHPWAASAVEATTGY